MELSLGHPWGDRWTGWIYSTIGAYAQSWASPTYHFTRGPAKMKRSWDRGDKGFQVPPGVAGPSCPHAQLLPTQDSFLWLAPSIFQAPRWTQEEVERCGAKDLKDIGVNEESWYIVQVGKFKDGMACHLPGRPEEECPQKGAEKTATPPTKPSHMSVLQEIIQEGERQGTTQVYPGEEQASQWATWSCSCGKWFHSSLLTNVVDSSTCTRTLLQKFKEEI